MMRFIAGLALVIAIAVGMLVHRPSPRAPVSRFAEEAQHALTMLRAGDTTLVIVDVDPASRPELEPFIRLTLATALSHGAHVVTVSLTPYGAMLAQTLLDDALVANGKTYGHDALNLGFLEGRSAAVHLLGLPLDRVSSRDHAGTVLADLAITRDIQKLDDAALTVLVSSGNALDWVTQAQDRFIHKLVVASTSQYTPELVPFFESGQLAGLVGGLRDVAAITPATAGSALDHQVAAQRWSAIAFITLLVLGHGITLLRLRPRSPAPVKKEAVT